ncbi:ArnT family glycosyltransferase [Candidatus Omnitrophota bacterium]
MHTATWLQRILLVIIILGAVYTNIIWLCDDTSVQGVDSRNHLLFSVEFYYEISDIVQNEILSAFDKVKNVITVFRKPARHSTLYWPNAVNAGTAVCYSLFGLNTFAAKLSLTPYLIILLLSTYYIGSSLHSRNVGLLSAFLVFMFPIIHESSRQFQLDFPLTCMVAGSLALLLMTDDFRKTTYSVLFGCALGWAMLVKGQAVMYLLGPLFIVFVSMCIFSGKEIVRENISSKQLHNIIIALNIVLLFVSLWWFTEFDRVRDSLFVHIFNKSKILDQYTPVSQKWSFESMMFYFGALYKSIGLPLFSCFIVSLLFLIKRKAKRKEYVLFFLMGTYLIFTFIFTVKHMRYMMPSLVGVAVVIAWGIFQIKNKAIKISAIILIVIYSLFQFYVTSFTDIDEDRFLTEKIKWFGFSEYKVEKKHYNQNYYIDQLISSIRKHTESAEKVKMGIFDFDMIAPSGLENLFWIRAKDRSMDALEFIDLFHHFIPGFDNFDFIVFFVRSDFAFKWPSAQQLQQFLDSHFGDILIRAQQWNEEAWDDFFIKFNQEREKFELVETYNLEDSNEGGKDKVVSICHIYKRKTSSDLIKFVML